MLLQIDAIHHINCPPKFLTMHAISHRPSTAVRETLELCTRDLMRTNNERTGPLGLIVRPRSPLFILCSQQRFCVVEMARICPLSRQQERNLYDVKMCDWGATWDNCAIGNWWPPKRANRLLTIMSAGAAAFKSISHTEVLFDRRRSLNSVDSFIVAAQIEKTFLSGWTNFQVPTSCALHSPFTMCNVWPLFLGNFNFQVQILDGNKIPGKLFELAQSEQ